VCTAQCREALFLYCTVYRGTVCVLHSLQRHCVCTAQCREALCVYCTVYRGTVCVLHSVERHCVCTAQSTEAYTVNYIHAHTHMHHGQICCRNTDYVRINGHDRTITVILANTV